MSDIKQILDDKHWANLSDSLWRDRISWLQFHAASVPNGSKVLDIGAGTCIFKPNFAHCDYISQDLAELEGNPYGKIDIVSDINNIPLQNSCVDVILCTEVLEHVPEPVLAIKEMSRLLKPKGKLLLTAPLISGKHQAPYHFYGGYTYFFYEKYFKEEGLKIISLEKNGNIYDNICEFIWRTSGSLNHYRNKGIIGRIYSKIIQTCVYNLSTYYFKKQSLKIKDDDYPNGYFVIAEKE